VVEANRGDGVCRRRGIDLARPAAYPYTRRHVELSARDHRIRTTATGSPMRRLRSSGHTSPLALRVLANSNALPSPTPGGNGVSSWPYTQGRHPLVGKCNVKNCLPFQTQGMANCCRSLERRRDDCRNQRPSRL